MQVGIPETVIVPAPRKISQRRAARAHETAPSDGRCRRSSREHCSCRSCRPGCGDVSESCPVLISTLLRMCGTWATPLGRESPRRVPYRIEALVVDGLWSHAATRSWLVRVGGLLLSVTKT